MVVVIASTICALIWICYRVSSLLNIPIPILVKLLGHDLPSPPRVSLHGISPDTITLHWSLPEKAGSIAKHIIQINGINVGESEKRGETSVSVTGLNPDHRYNVRVIAANSQNFRAPGQLIRLRTQKTETIGTTGIHDRFDSVDDFRPVLPITDVPSSQQLKSTMNYGNGQFHRRVARERRSCPGVAEQIFRPKTSSSDEQHSVENLTRDLDLVRNEIEETEFQLVNAEEEYKSAEVVLRAELDTLKRKKNEEDAGRQRIKAETKSLEETRRSAEATKVRTEKSLRIKEYEIKKIRDDIAQWQQEKIVALNKVEELSSAAKESKENAVTTKKELSIDIHETQKQIAEMEEDIRSFVGSLKALDVKKQGLKTDEDFEAHMLSAENEKERIWRHRRTVLEMRYVTIYNAFQSAEMDFVRSRDTLLVSRGCRGSGSEAVSITKKPKQRRSRNRKGRPTQAPSPINSFSLQDSRFPETQKVNNVQYQMSPTYSKGMPCSPFFNFANGTVTSSIETLEMNIADPVTEISGTPMSPTANALLPSNLFAVDDGPPSPTTASVDAGLALRCSTFDKGAFTYSQSHSRSVPASPHSSFNRIPLFQTLVSQRQTNVESSERIPISPIGISRLAIRSNHPEGEQLCPNPGGHKFVRLLSNSFVRQRGKTMPFDGPPIGSLRSSESHSFPKNDAGLDPIGTRRRSGSYGSWTNGFEVLNFSQSEKTSLERTSSQASCRSSLYNQFNQPSDPMDPKKLFDAPASPRPSSIASFDNPLPVPSSDASAAFGWPTDETFDISRSNRIGNLAQSQWADFRSSQSSCSRPISRPMSPITNNSSTSLSTLPSQQMHSSLFGYHTSSTLNMNPIVYPITPRLNPAAPTFQSKHAISHFTHTEEGSKDAMSIRTDISIASTTGTGTSGASSEAVHTKDSILSRFSLSRKVSTSKFNIGWKKVRREESEDEDVEGGTALVSGSGARNLWISWKKDKDRDEGEDCESEKSDRTATVTSSKERMRTSQNVFFGTIGRRRGEKAVEKDEIMEEKCKETREREKDKVIKDSDGDKRGLGIFKRKAPFEKERDEAA